MIALEALRLQRGQNVLLEKSSARIDTGQRVGLVGQNGVGKSSLFALLRGDLSPDEGNAIIPKHWVIAHVAQEMEETEDSALNFVLAGDEELTRYNAELEVAHDLNDGELMGHIYAEMTRIDAYSAPARAAQLLNGLGFAQHQHDNPVTSFSGGWRMRLNLARALMCRSDLLLLDEPTNHLDLDTVLWLEDYLKNHPATLIMISHDRDFLDALCSHIIEIANQRLTSYKGNYSQYERIRGEHLMQQQAQFQEQQRHIAHLNKYINRFRAQATKARQAQSRIKALDRLELISPAYLDSPFSFEFSELPDLPNPQLQAEKLNLGYGDNTLLTQIAFTIQSDDRIGLLGMNGSGKSTLIKALAGELAPLSGEIITAPNLRIGYFSQQHLDTLRENESPIWHLMRLAPDENIQLLRNFLGGFNFRGDRVNESILHFSGGEKARLALALLIWKKPHLLLLDEPTNHLDLDMRHALVMALQQFDGALIVVSHDRSLLANCVDQFWLVADQTVKPFDGDLQDYRQWSSQTWQLMNKSNHGASNTTQKASAANATDHTQASDAAVQTQSPAKPQTQTQTQTQSPHTHKSKATLTFERKNLEKDIQKAEKKVAALQAELETTNQWLLSDKAYQPDQVDQLVQHTKQAELLTAQLATLEEQWLEMLDRLEQYPA